MVFPSVPVYLDHSSWLQQQAGDSVIENLQLTPVPPARGDGGTVEINRPYSMSERARLAKLPYPEAPLKCPRCASTNTKFCYFNNYSLSQPRHFCKTCRRYWTRGGALRDVPVGGGCRRRSTSKKSKGSQSKSPITSTISTPISSNTSIITNKFVTNSSMYSNIPIFPSLPNVPELEDVVGNELGFPIDKPSPTTTGTLTLPAAFGDQWMMSTSSHQLNLSGRFDQPAGTYNFEREAINPLIYDDETGFGQLSSISVLKQEENQGTTGSLSRNYMRLIPGNYDQYWSANTWKDLSATSSASHFM